MKQDLLDLENAAASREACCVLNVESNAKKIPPTL